MYLDQLHAHHNVSPHQFFAMNVCINTGSLSMIFFTDSGSFCKSKKFFGFEY